MLRRLARWLGVALVLILGSGYAAINLSGHDPQRWHVDPVSAGLRGTPNEILAAPPGTTAAAPHIATQVHAASQRALLARFDAVARAQPRTQVVAGDVESGMISYVQRTPVIGFPDYLTVKAVPVGDGAGLVVWSRSRYGRDDLGANRQRVRTWLGELGEGAAPAHTPAHTPGQPSSTDS
ncbi:MAG TPA: DUF1499 domain-containing protein [Thermohalobaculum sp.]|nr:DUF1499 domain-containing protein [Thermohalobaculum sp.]